MVLVATSLKDICDHNLFEQVARLQRCRKRRHHPSRVVISVLLIVMGQLKIVCLVIRVFLQRTTGDIDLCCKSAACLPGACNLGFVKSKIINCHINQSVYLCQRLEEFHFRS